MESQPDYEQLIKSLATAMRHKDVCDSIVKEYEDKLGKARFNSGDAGRDVSNAREAIVERARQMAETPVPVGEWVPVEQDGGNSPVGSADGATM